VITPLDVLLVSRAKVEGLHAGGDLRPNREGLFLKLDGPADGHRSGAGDGSDTKQQVVLPAEPPIDLSGKSGVITEGKIPIEIELVVGTIGSEKTARVRKPPSTRQRRLSRSVLSWACADATTVIRKITLA